MFWDTSGSGSAVQKRRSVRTSGGVTGPGRRIDRRTTPKSRASAGNSWVRPGPDTHPEPWSPSPSGWWMPGPLASAFAGPRPWSASLTASRVSRLGQLPVVCPRGRASTPTWWRTRTWRSTRCPWFVDPQRRRRGPNRPLLRVPQTLPKILDLPEVQLLLVHWSHGTGRWCWLPSRFRAGSDGSYASLAPSPPAGHDDNVDQMGLTFPLFGVNLRPVRARRP